MNIRKTIKNIKYIFFFIFFNKKKNKFLWLLIKEINILNIYNVEKDLSFVKKNNLI